jgi:hypothetical protein
VSDAEALVRLRAMKQRELRAVEGMYGPWTAEHEQNVAALVRAIEVLSDVGMERQGQRNLLGGA